MEGPADPYLRQWWPLVESRAKALAGVGGAEYDDLIQEGAIAVWKLRDTEYKPSRRYVDRALVDYIRTWSHRGQKENHHVHDGGGTDTPEGV